MKLKKRQYIFINIVVLFVIFLIGLYFEEQQKTMSLCFTIYLLGLCSYALYKYINENKMNISCEKIITIAWVLLGILLIVSTLFIRYRFYPIILLYAVGSFVLMIILVILRKE